MKNNWQTKKLGEVCDISTGKWDANHAVENGGYRFFTCAREPMSCNTKRFSGECLILPGNGVNVGDVYYYEGDFDAYQRTYVINKIKSYPKYLFYHMLAFWKERNLNKQYGSATNFLKIGNFNEYEIPIPPLHEQKRIVAILDEAFAAIDTAKENAEKNLANACTIFESHLQSVFTQRGKGWMEKSLGSLASFRNGINYTKDSKGDRIKIVGVRNFKKNFSAPMDDLDTVTIDGELSELDSLRQDDILAVRSNGNIELIGRCILVGEVTEKVSHSGFTIRIRLSNGEVLPRYLCHFIKSASSRKRLTDGGTGTNIKSLNQGMLSTLAIPFPPISVQKILVEKLESLSVETKKLEAIYRQKLTDLDELKKSVLQKAFNGELA